MGNTDTPAAAGFGQRLNNRILVASDNGKLVSIEVNRETRQLFIGFEDGGHFQHALTFNGKRLGQLVDALVELSDLIESSNE